MNIASYIDHTALKPTLLKEEVSDLCSQAKQYQFAAVCIPPMFVKQAKAELANTAIKTATVIGFPFGYSAIEAKVSEIILAIADGVDELDMVINLIALKNNDWQYLAKEINTIMPIINKTNKGIKLILETGVLTDDEIKKCCDLYTPAQPTFLKTSTGYAEVGATTHAVKLLRANLPESIHIKASGGIRTYDFAKELVENGATRLGCSASVAIVKQQNMSSDEDAISKGY